MAQNTLVTAPEPASPKPPDKAGTKWYRRPWIYPLFAAVGIFVLMRLPVYLQFDSSDSVMDLQASFPETHYALMSFHVIFGSIAIVTCAMQIWPWLRQHHPRVHRTSGRVYVFAGVLPGGLLALVVSLLAVRAVPGITGNVVLSLLWLGTTYMGYRAARERRFREHRQWMIRSFALCMSIVANRVWVVILALVLMPFLDGYYDGSMDALIQDVAVTSIWISWIVNLIIAEWWMSRRPKRAKRAAPATKVAVGA